MMKQLIYLLVALFGVLTSTAQQPDLKAQVAEVLRDTVMQKARWALEQKIVTVTDSFCERSAGGLHDFYSEGDYWWPNKKNPNAPYEQRDGQTNPDNFVDHRLAMIRFSEILGALGSAYVLTGDDQYVSAATKHAKAWFCDSKTKMNPSLLYAQAIKGRVTGRGIGIIDTIHLMEVSQTLHLMVASPAMDASVLKGCKAWFKSYCRWLTTHPYGVKEMNAKNNHGTCWALQVAAFASFIEDKQLLRLCAKRYQDAFLAHQMAADGSFPLELERTKPYSYSIFNLDAMVTLCQILAKEGEASWSVQTSENLSIAKAVSFLAPYLEDKSTWPYPHDVMFWDEWPVAQPAMLFAAIQYKQDQWFKIWAKYDHSPKNAEVVRNLPIRNPLLWL